MPRVRGRGGVVSPDPRGWNVYRWLTSTSDEIECVGSAQTRRKAYALALRLDAPLIQRGLDGEVEVVKRPGGDGG